MTRRAFVSWLGVVALVGFVCRLFYVSWESAHDPTFARPILDGAFYLDWARGLLASAGEPPGAFYLAPLFPHLLAVLFWGFGENWMLLYAVQQALVIGAAVLLGLGFVDAIGETSALLAASAIVLYHPGAFFAARPIGEPLALFLSALGLFFYLRSFRAAPILCGVVLALSALARPNLLLLVAGLVLVEAARRHWKTALFVASAAALTLVPVGLRNLRAGGHPVPISSNSGITLYHGNGPGALGVFTPAEGFSGAVATQRDEATALARTRSGKSLDAVEADRWWGREAARTRLRDPQGSARLVATRAVLLVDSYEHGLDDAPRLDENPWRFAFPLPFAILLGFATAGVAALGFARSGGAAAWSAILATAATPIVFYVSSRYRLPMGLFLAIPAGVGAAAILGASRPAPARARRVVALVAGAAAAVVSWAVPSASLARHEEAAAHANRASVYAEARDLDRALREGRRALALDPSSVLARYNLAVSLAGAGRTSEAEALYREVLVLDPAHAESAGNLAKLLVERGAAREAVPILERALLARPADPTCWANLVVAWIALGDGAAARDALDRAHRAGVKLSPGLAEAARGVSNTMERTGDTGR